MSKMTLLEIVQDILNDMDGEPINDINDTPESLQVAQIVKTTYYEIINRNDWAQHNKLFQLSGSGDSAKPTHMTMAENLKELKWIKYNKRQASDTRDKYQEVWYKDQEDFLRFVNDRDSSDSTVTVVTDDNSVKLLIRNDRAPEFYTSFDDVSIVFDAHDVAVDTTLQGSKTQAYGIEVPTWTVDDSFTPELPIDGFPLLLAEAKSVAMLKLKQVSDQKAEQQATRQQRRMSQNHWRVASQQRWPDYGRKGHGIFRSPRLRRD